MKNGNMCPRISGGKIATTPMRRQQRPEHVGIAERIDDPQLGKSPGGQPEIHTDGGDVSGAGTASCADHEFEPGQRRGDRLDQKGRWPSCRYPRSSGHPP